MSHYPKVFIIILNYNGKKWLKNCLSSLYSTDYLGFEIVVVDNNSTDSSFEEARLAFPKASYIKNEENIGYAAGNNIAIRYALDRGAEYLLLLNFDTLVKKDFLKKLVDICQKDKQIGLASPLIYFKDTKDIWFSGGSLKWFFMKAVHQRKLRREKFWETQFLSGCAMLIKKEVIRKIGFLDEDYFLYWEDADFSFRAKKAGFKAVVVRDSIVWHYEDSKVSNKNKIYWLVISGLIFFKKNSPLFLRPWLALYVAVRKAKNWKDRKWGKNETAEAVGRAYKDFNHAKLQ